MPDTPFWHEPTTIGGDAQPPVLSPFNAEAPTIATVAMIKAAAKRRDRWAELAVIALDRHALITEAMGALSWEAVARKSAEPLAVVDQYTMQGSMLREIVLHNGLVTFVDDDVYDRLGHYHWTGIAPGYACRWIPKATPVSGRQHSYLHREIMGDPAGLIVDHIDRNPLNNVQNNLRVVTKSEDLKNRGSYVRRWSLKPFDNTQDRYEATPLLASVVKEQGRRRTWMGEQIRVSNSHVAHVLAGRRTVTEADARIWAGILGVPFSSLWKLAKRSSLSSVREYSEVA